MRPPSLGIILEKKNEKQENSIRKQEQLQFPIGKPEKKREKLRCQAGRPSELATIKVKDGVAKFTATKRNARNMKKPPKTRSVKPLEIDDRNHEGARVLALIEAGGEMGRFPKALKYQIERVMDPSHENHTTSFRDVGACFNQMLCRSLSLIHI